MTNDEMNEAADAIETLAGIDEGENLDTARLHELAHSLRADAGLSEKLDLIVNAGMLHASASETMRQALGSVIDVLDELCMGLAVGQTPDRPWAETVSQTFSEHRKRLGFSDSETL